MIKHSRKRFTTSFYTGDQSKGLIKQLAQNLDKQNWTQISVAVYKSIHPSAGFYGSVLCLLSGTHTGAADLEEGQEVSTASRAETAIPTNKCDAHSWDGGKEKVEEGLKPLGILTPRMNLASTPQHTGACISIAPMFQFSVTSCKGGRS